LQAALIRLTGPARGEAHVFEEDLLRLGTHQTNDLVLDERRWPMVAPFHVEIRQKDGTFLLVDVSFAGLWVNGQKVSEVFLADRDTIQLGENGPQFRFRLGLDRDGRRPLPAIFSDSRAIARVGGETPLVSATDFLRHLARGLVREASWSARATVVGLFFVMVAFLVLVPFFLVRGYRAVQRTQQAVSALTAGLREERLSREELGKRVEAEQGRLARQQSEILRLGEERERLRSALEATETNLRRLESERVAAERVIARYSGGVAFIQGALGFRDPAGRPLRFVGTDEKGQPLRDATGRPMLSPDGKGPPATTPFTGSGFLVSRDGKILTNRHVAEPWRDEEELAPLRAAGYTPELTLFRAFFPGLSKPVPLRVLAVSPEADVALLQGAVGRGRLPVLELDRAARDAVPGRPVILLGYPAGIEALLAKAEAKAMREVLAGEILDVYRLAEDMAAKGMIRPSATQGHLGDVQPHQLSYDAQTAIGGSGGPLLSTSGRVIGINYGFLAGFAGSNFAIPIRFGLELMGKGPPR
jgi:S1-C subfamily serine protease